MLNQDSSVVFLISSAIEVPLATEETFKSRLIDTLSTINSINAHFTNAKIFIIESSWKTPREDIAGLMPDNVEIFDFWNDPYILTIQSNSMEYAKNLSKKYRPKSGSDPLEEFRVRYIKNATECYSLTQFMSNTDLSGYERIFKISGRYCLQPKWDLTTHDVPKFVTSEKYASNQSGLISIDYLRMCYMWSAPGLDYETLKNFMLNVKNEVYHALFKNELIDMEHAFYKHLPPEWVHELQNFKIFSRVSGSIPMIR